MMESPQQDIQKILVKSASDLISLENPNYQFVACKTTIVWNSETSIQYKVERFRNLSTTL